MAEQTRYSLITWEMMHVLRDASEPLTASQVNNAVRTRTAPTAYELEKVKSGGVRWEVVLGFKSGDAVTAGWMTKRGGWALTEAGIGVLEVYTDPEALYADLQSRVREVDQQRRKAMQSLNEVQQFIAEALRAVEAGQWTAHEDLAELAATSPAEVANFLASWKIQIPNAYRVLNADGSIPDEGMLNATYRGIDLQERLAKEGLEFDGQGRALQEQRLSAGALKDLLDALREAESGTGSGSVPTAKRAWLVRGANVDGFNLVPQWVIGGYVSLSASQLSDLEPGISYDELRQAVDTAYQHKSYAYRGQRLEELDRFIRRMHEGDLLITPMHGGVYIGKVTGPTQSGEWGSPPQAGLGRRVRWYNPNEPIDGALLLTPLPALLQSQASVVDLTEAYDQLAALAPAREEPAEAAREPARKQRVLAFEPVAAETAADLLMDWAELQKIADLLWERRQVIFYGPPGTGKTYLAKALARHLTDDSAVRLVQFHPSYTYEDFFEGFRPKSADDGTGALTFELTPGPFRLFAEAAKDNPTTPYILIIDEINRANLAKVFGELYFLLEYRDEAISLQYSPKEEFTLPPNLFLIGTMNTADRSIARIDTAMRRRFAFIELDPRIPPVEGLLGRWLASRGRSEEPARLLDALNSRLADADAAIGPSYLMKSSIYDRTDGLERVWQYEILPLLEDLFYGQRDIGSQYGLSSLRRSIGTSEPS